MVRRASGKVLHVGGQQDTGEIVVMSLEGTDGNNACGVVSLNHAPQINIALVDDELR